MNFFLVKFLRSLNSELESRKKIFIEQQALLKDKDEYVKPHFKNTYVIIIYSFLYLRKIKRLQARLSCEQSRAKKQET